MSSGGDVVKIPSRVITSYAAYSGPGLYVKDSNVRCAMRSVSHDILISDTCVAVVRSTHEFENPHREGPPGELFYKFVRVSSPQYHSVVVEFMEPKSGAVLRTLAAQVMETDQVEEAYDDVIAESSVATMIRKEQASGVVSLSLGIVASGVILRVISVVVQELEVELVVEDDVKNEKFLTALRTRIIHAVLPAEKKKKKSVDIDVNLNVRVELPAGAGQIHALSAKTCGAADDRLRIEKKSSSHWEAHTCIHTQLSSGSDLFCLEVLLDDDIATVVDNVGISWVVEKVRDDMDMLYSHAHFVSVFPRFTPAVEAELLGFKGEEMVLIVDRSGSMGGDRIKCAKKALLLFLQSLDPERKILFDIVSFGTKQSSLFSSATQFDRKSFSEAKEHVTAMQADMGDTDILAPIELALHRPLQAGFRRQVFLLTDGEDRNHKEILACVRAHASTTRFFTFGIGRAIDPKLLDDVAAVSHGQSAFISDVRQIQGAVLRQLERATELCLDDIQLTFPFPMMRCDGPKETHTLSTTHVLANTFNRSRASAMFFSGSKGAFDEDELGEASVSFSVFSKGRRCRCALKPTFLTTQTSKSSISVLAAQKRIASLEARHDKAGSAEALRLSLQFSLPSSQTSFVLTVPSLEPPHFEVIPTRPLPYRIHRPKWEVEREEAERKVADQQAIQRLREAAHLLQELHGAEKQRWADEVAKQKESRRRLKRPSPSDISS